MRLRASLGNSRSFTFVRDDSEEKAPKASLIFGLLCDDLRFKLTCYCKSEGKRKRARNIVPLLEKADRSYIIQTNNPAFRRNPFQTGLQSRPRRAARKDHPSPIRERQTMSP